MQNLQGGPSILVRRSRDVDPVIALVAARLRIEVEAEAKIAPLEGAEAQADAILVIVSRASKRISRLDDKIAATVATSPAGLIGQVRVLVEVCVGQYSETDYDRDAGSEVWLSTRLADTIIAGIERLAGGGPIDAPFLRSIPT
jgi:hypothetical protein